MKIDKALACDELEWNHWGHLIPILLSGILFEVSVKVFIRVITIADKFNWLIDRYVDNNTIADEI